MTLRTTIEDCLATVHEDLVDGIARVAIGANPGVPITELGVFGPDGVSDAVVIFVLSKRVMDEIVSPAMDRHFRRGAPPTSPTPDGEKK